MILNSKLANELFRGFYIERWNDRIRPMMLTEMDKHGHKLVLAYCIGKYEETQGTKINWNLIFSDAIFEFLRRIIISDIKSPIYQEIKQNQEVFKKLNEYIFAQYEKIIPPQIFLNDFQNFLFNKNNRTSLEYRIIDAAHIYASYWEFKLVKCANPFQYQNEKIEREMMNRLMKYDDLIGIDKLQKNESITNFIDLCGQLRFQIRWAQTPRVPKTSVLGHIMLVTAITYLISLDLNCCDKRLYNNFFGALFHDLPEAVTRDIISPVKRSSEKLDNLITKLEKELADNEIFPYVEKNWIEELRYFTQNEFDNKVKFNGNTVNQFDAPITTKDISEKYNEDKFSPIDGEIIRFADHYSAYLEAKNSIDAGIKSKELLDACDDMKAKYKNKTFVELKVFELYN
jgi:putative hydrolases of HD superfamily